MSAGSRQKTVVPCGACFFSSFWPSFFSAFSSCLGSLGRAGSCPPLRPAANAQAERVSANVSAGMVLRNIWFSIFDTPRMSDCEGLFGCGGVNKKELTVEALACGVGLHGPVAAVGAEHARLHVVAEVGGEQHVLQVRLQPLVAHGGDGLDAAVEVARHPVGAAGVKLLLAAVGEVVGAAVFE